MTGDITSDARGTATAAPSPLPDFAGYTTLDSEVDVGRLPITGRIPEWLTGTLIRNGPAKFEVGEYRLTHWFNGLAMLHAYSFASGQVSYSNRYLRSTAYNLAVTKGQLYGKQFGLDPCKKLFGRHFAEFSPLVTDNVNVNVVKVAGHYLALAEQPLGLEFDPVTLETVGEFAFEAPMVGETSTPHPHVDFDRHALISYTTTMRGPVAYQVFAIPEGKTRQDLVAVVRTDEPCYMHSFAMTENYVVLVEFPVVIDKEKFVEPGKPYLECFRWEPERPTRFRVIDKRQGKLVRTFESASFFAFHHVNAFEEGGDILIDVAAAHTPYETVLGLPPSEDQFDLEQYGYAVRRYRLALSSRADSAEFEQVGDVGIEMPSINYRSRNTRPYRYAYGLGHSPRSLRAMNRLVKLNVEAGTHDTWYEKGCFPSEAIFVPRPGATAEDDGAVLSAVLDGKTGRSFMLVLDGRSFLELGRAQVPHHIPSDFHGQFFPDLRR